jgi:hypothetical protein
VWLCFTPEGVDFYHDVRDPQAILPRFTRTITTLVEHPSAMRCALGLHDGPEAEALARISRIASLDELGRIEHALADESIEPPDLDVQIRAALAARRRTLEREA